MSTRTIMVCGSRGWTDETTIRVVLAAERHENVWSWPTVLIHGAADGADMLAAKIALSMGYDVRAFPPNYKANGSAAPHVRNDEMLQQAPARVYAFWDGKSRGTQSVIDKAAKLGIRCTVEVAR